MTAIPSMSRLLQLQLERSPDYILNRLICFSRYLWEMYGVINP